jgi:hypothetical protein
MRRERATAPGCGAWRIPGDDDLVNGSIFLHAYTGHLCEREQIVQALKAHHVLATNVVPESGLSSFQGATSGVWATTAPGDSAAVFGGRPGTVPRVLLPQVLSPVTACRPVADPVDESAQLASPNPPGSRP